MKRLSTLLLAMVATAASAAIYPSSDWFGTNVQKQTTAAGVRAALGITSTGGSATNVYFTAGQSTTPRTVGGSNTFDVVGTLTNSTIGSAALATNAINATNLFGQISADHVDLSALLDIGVLYNNAGGMDAYSLGELGSLVSPYLTNALGSGFSDGFNKGTTGRLIAEFSNFSLDNAGFLWVNGLGINDDSSSLTNIPSKWFTSIAAMTNIAGVANQVVYVDSYFGSNMWGGGKFKWENSSATIDNGIIFASPVGGRWRRIDTGYPTNYVFMEHFGVVPNAVIDQYAGAQAAINATPTSEGNLILPSYNFAVGTTLTWTNRRGCYFGTLTAGYVETPGYRVYPNPTCVIHWRGANGGTNLVAYDVGHNTFRGFGLDTRIGLNNGDQYTNAAGLLMDVDMNSTHTTTTTANVFDGLYFRERHTNSALVGLRIASYNWQNCEFFQFANCSWQGGGANIPEYWISVTNIGASKAIQLGGNGGGQNSFNHTMRNCGFDRWQYFIHSSGGQWDIVGNYGTASGAAAYYLNCDGPCYIRGTRDEGDHQFVVSPSTHPVTLIGNQIAMTTGMSVANVCPVDVQNLIAFGNKFQHEATIPSITNSFNSTGWYLGSQNSFCNTNDALIASWRFNSAFNSHGDFGTLKANNNIQSGPWKVPSATQETNVVYQNFTDGTASTMALTMMPSNGVFGVGSYLNNVHFGVYNPDLNKTSFQFGDSVINPRFKLLPSSSGLITELQLLGSNSVWMEFYSGSGSTATRLDITGASAVNKIHARTGSLKITGTNDTDLVTFGTDYKIKFPYDTNFEVVGPIQGNSVRVTNFLTLFTNDNQAGISTAPTRYGQMTHFNSNGVEHVKVATTSGTLDWAGTNVVPLTAAQVVGKFSGTPNGTKLLRDDGTLAATIPRTQIDLGVFADTYLLYNNAGGIDALPQSTFLSTPLGVTNNATLSSGFLVGGDGARGVTNVAVGSGLSLSGGTLTSTSTGGGGFGTNTAAASSWTNSNNHIFSGTVAVTGTLIAGNWASAMNPGSFSIYNIRTDGGTSAGTYVEGSLTANGVSGWLAAGGTKNDTLDLTNQVLRTLGGFATNSVTDFVIGTRYTNGTQRTWISASFYLVSSATGVASVNLKVEQAFKTNMTAIALGNIAAATATNTLQSIVAPGAFFYFTDGTSGSGASATIVANSSSRIEL